MLNYTKVILEKVSFDGKLFEKELAKAIKWLNYSEIVELKQWSQAMFGHIYSNVLERCFDGLLI